MLKEALLLRSSCNWHLNISFSFCLLSLVWDLHIAIYWMSTLKQKQHFFHGLTRRLFETELSTDRRERFDNALFFQFQRKWMTWSLGSTANIYKWITRELVIFFVVVLFLLISLTTCGAALQTDTYSQRRRGYLALFQCHITVEIPLQFVIF